MTGGTIEELIARLQAIENQSVESEDSTLRTQGELATLELAAMGELMSDISPWQTRR